MQYPWLKLKKYPHIGIPLRKKDLDWIIDYVTNPEKTATHKFVPLLHRKIEQRKYRPVKGTPKNESGKRQRIIGDKKVRHIYFPSHLDSIIYSYYNHQLTLKYEDYLKDKPYGSVAVAYRKIPIGNGKSGNKCNIEFAFEAFDFIENNKERKLSIIVADVTSFFDNLDHRFLHRQWKRILNTDNLPDDHYALYKNLISKRYVNENELFKKFHSKMFVERHKPQDTSKKEFKRKYIKKIYNLRKENVVAYCTIREFFNEATDIIHVEKPLKKSVRASQGKEVLKGIPQGTPISATLANVYMLDFDERIHKAASSPSKNAYYQRYSDDLIIICDQNDENYFNQLIIDEIENKANLEVNADKNKIYRYKLNSESEFKGGILNNGKINPHEQLDYLGFTYDGLKVRVKTGGFSKFYRNMKRSFKRGAFFAKQAHIPSDSLFESRLYKKYTHVGSQRRLIYLPNPDNPKEYVRSTHSNWGNFISYLSKANLVMREINGDDTIIKQSRKIWNKFHEIKKQTYEEIGSCAK